MRVEKRASRVVILTAVLLSAPLAAEPSEFQVPRSSPAAVVNQRVAATDIEITYNRPSARGREIFGGLVPYGQVWRTGADQATQIAFSTPLSFGGTVVEAGTYELFTIPGEAEWTVILQPSQDQWGSYAYDPARDVARVQATASTLADPVESLTLGIGDLGFASATLTISWQQAQVSIPLAIDVETTVVPRLEAALRGSEGRKLYFRAAMFYFENDLDLDRAAELMALAVEGAPEHLGMLYRQALILERKGDVEGAIAAAEKSLDLARESGQELRDEYIRLNGAVLKRLQGE